MKTFVTVVGGVLLALSCVTASNARPHAQRHFSQSEPPYYDTDYSQRPTRDWDSSCFQSAGLAAMYACNSNGG